MAGLIVVLALVGLVVERCTTTDDLAGPAEAGGTASGAVSTADDFASAPDGGSLGDGGGGAQAGESGDVAAALAALEVLPAPTVAGQVPDYERTDFLPGGWADLDHDGCYSRNEILRRDLTDVTFEDGWCKVATGRLADPYSGQVIDFDKAVSTTTVQIDHVVPLAQAWRAGAWNWTKDQRIAFANDPAELLAVSGPANQSKGDSGPAEWLPRTGQCPYAAAYALLAARYGLAIPQADRDTLHTVLAACPT